MAIVKAIIDKMQGKIHVDSEQGKGTKFVIHIMLQALPNQHIHFYLLFSHQEKA